MNSADSESGQSSSQSYGKAAVKSSIWSFLGSISKQISQFLVYLVLARFLSPESFGLIGMVTLATGFALAISEMGLGNAIIQKQNATELDTHSLFWFNLALGTGLSVTLIIVSPEDSALRKYNQWRSEYQFPHPGEVAGCFCDL